MADRLPLLQGLEGQQGVPVGGGPLIEVQGPVGPMAQAQEDPQQHVPQGSEVVAGAAHPYVAQG